MGRKTTSRFPTSSKQTPPEILLLFIPCKKQAHRQPTTPNCLHEKGLFTSRDDLSKGTSGTEKNIVCTNNIDTTPTTQRFQAAATRKPHMGIIESKKPLWDHKATLKVRPKGYHELAYLQTGTPGQCTTIPQPLDHSSAKHISLIGSVAKF